MGWLLLAGAIVTEVIGTTCLKLSEGLRHPVPTALMFVLYGVSFVLLALVVKYLPVSVVYAVWSGAGTALIAAIGMVVFKEPATALRLACIGLIIVAVVGLNLAGGEG